MTQLEGKAARADLMSQCGPECPLFNNCRISAEPDSIAAKIAQLCSRKFREGYRKGYNQRKREEKQ